MFSERTRYIIRLLCYLGKENLDIFRTVKDLSERTGIPGPYLGKLVGFLAEKGYLNTRKGPAGGVSLAREPSEISINSLFEEIGEFSHSEKLNDTCCLPEQFNDCFIRKKIGEFQDNIIGKMTLEDAIEDIDPR